VSKDNFNNLINEQHLANMRDFTKTDLKKENKKIDDVTININDLDSQMLHKEFKLDELN
jgi:hypothetical protein